MKRTVCAIALILALILYSFPGAAALVDSPNGDEAHYNLSMPDQLFNLDGQGPVSAVIVEITGVKADGESRQSLNYKIESVLWQDIEELPKFILSVNNNDTKKGDRFVLFYGRHISYWGDSFRPEASIKLDGERLATLVYGGGVPTVPVNFIDSLDELQARLDRQPAPDHSVAAQIETATLIIEAKVLEVTGDGSVDYAFARVRPIAVYNGEADLRKELIVHPYRPLKEGRTYIFFLKEDLPEPAGGAPVLFAADKEAPFIRATVKSRREILEALD